MQNNTNKIKIKVLSAGFNTGNNAKIEIENVPVILEKNSNGHYWGLHMIIINQNDGIIVKAKVFDTYQSST